MSEDPTPLAQRLVRAVARASSAAEYEFGTAGTTEPFGLLVARRTTAAVLRELEPVIFRLAAEYAKGGPASQPAVAAYEDVTELLGQLADSIEKGEG